MMADSKHHGLLSTLTLLVRGKYKLAAHGFVIPCLEINAMLK